MDSINAVIGLAVLSSPLWLIVLIVPVAIVTAVVVAKRYRSIGAKFVSSLAVLLVFFTALFGDEIAGRMYLNHLCETEAGVRIYHTVELPAEYWDENGKPKFYNNINGNFTLDGYDIEYIAGIRSKAFHIDNAGYKRLDYKSRDVLGEVTDYRYWGGWLRREFSVQNTAVGCENRRDLSNRLVNGIFKKESH